MAMNFIGCDRDQAFLMPPSLREWVPDDHLVWTVLDAVGEMDLGAFYRAYRADGHGRPAYEPSMMVALLLYAYARGNRSSRAIERACVEDVAYRVVAGNLVPDHSTIAEFRVRHEDALAELFTGVLGLCGRAGLVSVGVVAIDGTKVQANASREANRSYEQIAREILAEAAETDRREDELYGESRGDELPERLRTSAGRRAALREAKEELEREREAVSRAQSGDEESGGAGDGALELDPGRFVTRSDGRRAWFREARRGLDEQREQEARPVARSRLERLGESARRLEEELAVERLANAAYEAWRQRGVAADGSRRMAPGTTKPYRPPDMPAGTINTTDPDSRLVKTVGQRALQGYNAQAAVNEHQIVVAAEVTVDSPDFGHLEPMVDATQRELAIIGAESPAVVVADAGYWHKRQMEKVVDRGIQVLIPPDSGLRKSARPGWDGGALRVHAPRALNRPSQGALPKTPNHSRAGIRADEVQPRLRPLRTPRKIGLPLGMAAVRREPQPTQAPQPPDRRRRGLRAPRRSSRAPRRFPRTHDADASPPALYPTATHESESPCRHRHS